MKIEVLQNYGGIRTNERRILPGVYDSDDERLFGLADFLLETMRAVIVEDIIPLEVVDHVHDKLDGQPMATISHDEIMKRKGRPTLSDEETTQTQEVSPLDGLRFQYKILADKDADERWGINRLQNEIKKLQ